MTNEDLAGMVDTSEEWIVSRTGISQRRISTGENTSQLAYMAAKKALENAGMDAISLDLIICATITPDSFMPSVACMVQDLLGASKAVAFDLSAACTGLIYAMAVGASFIENGMYQNILVIGAETLSKAMDWSDRSTCVLFGDGAGAIALSSSKENRGIHSIQLLSDGSKQDYLSLGALPLHNPFVRGEEQFVPSTIAMKGQEVFKFATRTITELINQVLDKANLRKEDIKYIVAHQANYRILELAAKSSGISLDKFYVNLDRCGNTSAASIGLALDEMNQKDLLQTGDKIILVGFGGGMTSGAIVVEWS